MKPEVSLCPHLRADRPELAIASDDVLDWYDGPITAVARCPSCPGLALLELLDWSRDHHVRIYALAGLEPEPLAVYRRNVRSATCDEGRFARETAALLSCAGPVERLLALDTRARDAVVAAAPAPAGLALPGEPWHERLPAERDASWFARLGLDKSG